MAFWGVGETILSENSLFEADTFKTKLKIKYYRLLKLLITDVLLRFRRICVRDTDNSFLYFYMIIARKQTKFYMYNWNAGHKILSSEKVVPIHKSTWPHNPEYRQRQKY